MDRLEWFERIAEFREGKPFERPFVKSGFLFSTDTICVLRTAATEETTAAFPVGDLDVSVFWGILRDAYKNLAPVGSIDALLLKEMAGEPSWEHEVDDADGAGYVKVHSAYFNKRVLARALAGWTSPEAKFSQVKSRELTLNGNEGKKVKNDSPETYPIVLTSGDLQVIISPTLLATKERKVADVTEFPESAIAK